MRLAAKVDSTHASIRDGLRKAGFSVFDTSKLGAGFVDLVVGKWGQTYLVECKTRRAKTKRGRITAVDCLGAAQQAFRDTWNGGPVIAAYSLQDAIYAVNMHLKRTGWVK